MSNEKSKSEKYLLSKSDLPSVSAIMANNVSQYRKQTLAGEVEKGLFKDGSGPSPNETGMTPNGLVVSSTGLKKTAQMLTSSNSFGTSGGADSVKQTPEVYSPLWLSSNLSLPRDRATINAWCRSFFALNPFVHNAISLHSTYPISKLNIKCYNKEVEKFFNDMVEELDLMNIAVQVAQEYWLLGEAFVYADYDKNKGKWSRLVIQNPDYMVLNRSVTGDPIISIRPDENLRKIVFSNKPRDVEQRRQLNQYIIDCVKRGDNIPMDNFHVSHIARKISPYEIRGTGLPVAIFRQLVLFDTLRESKFAQASNMINPITVVKIGNADYKPTASDLEAWRSTFECYDEETEVLTDQGFKKFNDVIEYSILSADGKKYHSTPKPGIKIGCFDPINNKIKFDEPTASFVGEYSGDMIEFKTNYMDIMVTPNHDMFTRKRYKENKQTLQSNWHKRKAEDFLSGHLRYQFRSVTDYEGDNIEYVNVNGKDVPIEDYLKFLGYFISEGCATAQRQVVLTQSVNSDCIDDMKSSINKIASIFNKKVSEIYVQPKGAIYKTTPSLAWYGRIYDKELFAYLKQEIGTDGKCTSHYKKIPNWIKSLNKSLLKILLDSMIKGDGSDFNNGKFTAFKYFTSSKQLADDVQEIVFKCGYFSTISTNNRKDRGTVEYIVRWSEHNGHAYPWSYDGKKHIAKKSEYSGKVWCFTVPTGLFVTRRNGKITIQGNSAQNDRDFKIFTHEGVTIERIGAGGGIYDISGDITQLIKEIYSGLQVPSVITDGGSDVSYANGGVALDVLRQRYMEFRNKMSTWLKRQIFQPIAKIQGFYEYKNGEKQLIIPDVDWNHMSLFDTADYVNTLVGLTQGEGEQKRASLHTLYRSLGLDAENENRNMRKEAIQAAIAKKEKVALDSLSLNELRALDEDDEIPEPKEAAPGAPGGESPVPGEMPGGMPPLDLGGGAPGLGAPPPPPPGGEAPGGGAPPPA